MLKSIENKYNFNINHKKTAKKNTATDNIVYPLKPSSHESKSFKYSSKAPVAFSSLSSFVSAVNVS